MRIETDGSTNTVTIFPNDGHHSGTVILMHGLGDSAQGWQDVAEQWAGAFPHIKFILPSAPRMPVTLNGGAVMPAWYDIVGLTDRASEHCDRIESSVATVRALIENEVAAGIRPSRIALAGFSQGGAMSLFTGLQLPPELKPAGLLVLSGYLPGASKFRLTPGFEDVRVLHCHGTSDPVVQFKWAEDSKTFVEAQGLSSYELKPYRGMVHTANMEEISYAAQFLSSIIPFDASLSLPGKAPRDMSVKELKAAIRSAGLGHRAAGFTEKHEFVSLLEEHLAGSRGV